MNGRQVNREVFAGSDMIALRLRAAKRPEVIDFLLIPAEEIDLEPEQIEPAVIHDGDVQALVPAILHPSEIQPLDEPRVIEPFADDVQAREAHPAIVPFADLHPLEIHPPVIAAPKAHAPLPVAPTQASSPTANA